MRIVWSATAVENLVQIREYISQDKPGAAQKFVKKLISAIELWSEHPHLGRPGREGGTREMVVSGTAYIVPYKISKGRVVVLAVLHGGRDRS